MRHSSSAQSVILAAVALAVGTLTASLGAHHGWGGYSDKEFELTGTVEKAVSLAGPHATMRVQSEGTIWDITLAPPARTERAGLKEGIIPVGAKVTAHGHRHMNPNRFEVKTERVIWGDKVFNVYPDRD